MSSTSPGGFVSTLGTTLWVTDASKGFCQIVAVTGGPSQLQNCVKPTPGTLFGQPAYDPIGFVYLPDYSGNNIWRYNFDGVVVDPGTAFPMTGASVSKPIAVALGGDGNLYVTNSANGNIQRITNPGGPSQPKATTIGATLVKGLARLAFVGADPNTAQLWIAEKNQVTVIASPLTCTTGCVPTPILSGIVSPTSIAFDGANTVYVGVASGVYRIDATALTSDFYSAYGIRNGTPSLYYGITALGMDNGNLYVIDDGTLGLTAGAATIYQVTPGLTPDGSAPQAQPPALPAPTVTSTATNNPAYLYSSGLTTPKSALWMGNHMWVLDHARGFCKVDPTLPSPSLTACAPLTAGEVPGQPAFDAGHNLLYVPDTSTTGNGIQVLAFDPVLETLAAPKSVASVLSLKNVVSGSTAPTALAFGGDGQLYVAMGATSKILRLTAPSTATHAISAIGSANIPGAANLAFNKGDLFDVSAATVGIMRNATLCTAAGTCTAQGLGATLAPPVSVTSDGTFTYIGEAKKVWKYDLVAGTLTNLADTGLSPNLVTTPFATIGGIAIDPLGQVYAADQGPLWQISGVKPTITSLSPTQGAATTTQTVTITGTNFSPGMTVTACPAITASGVTFVSASSITATLAIGPGPVGSCGISVVTAVGTSFPTNFTVLVTPPTLTAISPATGFRGASAPNNVSVTLTGTNMLGATLSAGPDITATITSTAATQIIANFAIPATAAVGPSNVTVTTPSGTSNALAFIISATTPTLTSINPTQGSAAAPVAATLVGSALIGATLNLPPGIALGIAPIVTATSISANLVIDATVSAGPQNISVTTPGGTTLPVTFNVLPVLTSIAPANAKAGTATIVTFTGSSLASLSSINAGANITVTNVLATSNQITATFTTLNSVALGAQSVTLSTPGGNSSAVTFTITAPTPILTGIAPVTGVRGASVPVILTGSGLVGATLNLPAGLALSGPPTVAFDTITAPLAIADNAPLGAQSITATTPGGTSVGVTFTVTAPVPALTSISPAQGSAASTVPVTFVGTGLVDATLTLPAGITLSGTPVVTVSSISANLVISPTATGATTNTIVNISVNTPGGPSNALSFTIAPRALLSIANTNSATFTQAQAGAAYTVTVSNATTSSPTIGPVTVTETAPPGLTLVSMAGTGWTCSGNACTRADALAGGATYPAITVTVNVSPTALSPQLNAVSVSGGNSFTANATDSTAITFLPPTLTSVAPVQGVVGTSVGVTLTGTNLTLATLNPLAGITATSWVVTASQILGTLNISPNAPVGPQSITINTPGGNSNAGTFTVLPLIPTLASITPASGVIGSNVTVTLTGTSLTGATLILSADITATSVVATDTKITATLAIAATAAPGPQPITISTAGGTSNAATFTLVKTDTTTQGTWKPVYGAGGQAIPNDVTNYPPYAQVAFTGQTAYTWNPSTTDVRATQKGVTAGRMASAWYAASTFNIDINLTDSLAHQVAVYCLDWDGANTRTERIDVVDFATGQVLASTPVSTFSSGQYLVWNLSGHVTLRVTKTAGLTAVVSGLFFDGGSGLFPALATIAPATGVIGTTVPITLTGTNLSGASLNLGAGITATGVLSNPTQITATLAIAATAPVGPQTISVTTPGGDSGAVTFTVNPLTPTATIAPTLGASGTSVPVTITGTSLLGATLTTNPVSGITATGVLATATKITATLNIAVGAPVGPQDITITTPGGTATATFNIYQLVPVLASIAPATGVIGTTVPVTLTGTNLNGAILNLGAGITATGLQAAPGQITASLVIAANAPLGRSNITVTTPGGGSNAITFAIVPLAKTDTATQGTWKPVYGAGGQAIANDVTNYPAYAQVAFTGQTAFTWNPSTADVRAPQKGVTAGRIASAWYSLSSFNIDINLTDGLAHQVALYCLDWDGANTRAERIDVLDPASGLVLASSSVSAFSPGQYLVWNLSGHVTLRVTRTAGQTAVVSGLFFDGSGALPALATIAPATGVIGTTVPITLTGTNLSGASLNLGAGITATGVLANPTQITATLAIAATAPVGPQTISVTTLGGDSGTVTFTVNPLAPTLATIAPALGATGTSVPVTLTGTNLTGATFSPVAGITATGVVATATKVTATFNIAAGAALGPQGITVTTLGGTTTAVTFTVVAPSGAAALVKTDTTTQGTWRPVYGVGGQGIANDVTNYPPYAQVAFTGQTAFTWNPSTADVRAPQKGIGTGRIASAWYSFSSYNIDINLTDGLTHQVAMYCLDWDGANARAERIDVMDPATGLVLASSSVSAFSSGQYLVWNLSGHVTLRVTRTAGLSAVVSGLFFGGGAGVLPALATIAPATGVIGTTVPVTLTGTNLNGATLNLGAGITATSVVANSTQITATLAIAATAPVGPQTISVSTLVGDSGTVTFTVNPLAPTLATIAPALGAIGTSVPVTLTGTNLTGATFSPVAGITATGVVATATKVTATFNIAAGAPVGPQSITVTTLGGTTTAVTFTVVAPSGAAALVKTDTTTQGTWKTVYGADGQAIPNDVTNYPAYAQVAFTGQTAFTWNPSTADVRAPQQGVGTGRIASAWYSFSSFNIDINLTDGLTHQVELYGLDWDGANTRAERIDVLDPATGLVLANSSVSAFSPGQYLVWNLSGHVTLRVTRTAGQTAVLSGLFFN